jgi:hypothetical protein
MKLKLDLHDIYNRGQDIDRALRGIIDEAVRTKAPLVEIIPGKGSGQLKKHVLRFLEQKDIKPLYHRVEKDSKNFGRVEVTAARGHPLSSTPGPCPPPSAPRLAAQWQQLSPVVMVALPRP